MATLIPSFSTCSQRMTSGERRFAQRLESKLEDDYLLWYDVPIGRKRLHPDFIVLHPLRGIIVLEVKDWKLSTIRSLDPDNAILVTADGCKADRNPLRQARDYMMAIAAVDRLVHHALIVEIKTDSYRKRVATNRSSQSAS